MSRQRINLTATRSPLVILLLACIVGVMAFGTASATGPVKPGISNGSNQPVGGEDSNAGVRPYIPGEVIVKLVADSLSVDSLNALYGTSVKSFFDRLSIYILNASIATDMEKLAEDIRTTPGVIFAHPNYVVSPLQSVQGSVPFSDADRIGTYPDQAAALRLRLAATHAIATGTGVKVGVVDGGVNFQHEELAGSVVSGWDFIDEDADAFDEPGGSNSGHGTFVAGVIHLVAPDAQLIAYRVADTSGRSNGDLVAEAILRAIDDGCRVVNLSLVMTHEHEVLRNALAYARSHDVLVVTAAGNESTSLPAYPASDPNVLAVVAVDTLDRLADFSRFGQHIDLCAPGTRVYAPYSEIFAWWSGTSFAAPFVAGQAALKLSQAGGSLNWSALHASLTATAENIDAANPDHIGQIGAGLIDPLRSLQDTVMADLAWTDPTGLYVYLAPNQTAPRCINLYATNPGAVFYAHLIGSHGLATFSDSVLEPGSTMCLTVSSNGKGVGNYIDTLLFDIAGVSNSPLMVPIVLIVDDSSGGPNYSSVMPQGMYFTVPGNWSTVIDAASLLTSTNAPAPYFAYVEDSSATWLEVVNPAGQTNDSVYIRLYPAGLADGGYQATVRYRVEGVATDFRQNIGLTVGDSVAAQDSAWVTPRNFAYSAELNSSVTYVGTAVLSTNTDPRGYTLDVANNSGWLRLVDSVGTTNDSVNFIVDPAAPFSAGFFTDTIFCHVEGIANVPAIVVSLEVLNDTLVTGETATATPAYFEIFTGPQVGAPIQARSFALTSTLPAAAYSIDISRGSSWLTVVDSAGFTDDSVRFVVDATGLPYGTYTDSLICHVNGATNTPLVAVRMTVVGGDDTLGSHQAYANPSSFALSAPAYSEALQYRSFVLSSTNAPADFQATSMFGSTWLRVLDSVGVTDDSVRFTVDAGGLGAGFYIDTIVCNVYGVVTGPRVPVMFTVYDDSGTTGETAAATPSAFYFSAPLHSDILQGSSFVLSSTNAPAAYTLYTAGAAPWIIMRTTSGATTDSVTFIVDPLAVSSVGTYVDTIVCLVDGAENVPKVVVAMTITSDSGSAPSAAVTPATVHRGTWPGSTTPIPVCVLVTSSNAPASYVAWVKPDGQTFTAIQDSTGTTNDSLCLLLYPGGLGLGSYYDTVLVSVSGVSQPVALLVHLAIEMPKLADVNNYPNPFNPETRISFTIGSSSRVLVTVYNALGQEVTTLLDEYLPAGRHEVVWHGLDDAGREASSGVYFYRVTTSEESTSRKMLLLK